MRRAAGLAGLLLLLVAAGAARADDADIAAARASALAQLDAFRSGDFDRAYTFASTEIRDQFGREAFERMVRLGYPQIATPTTVSVDGAERAANGSIFLFLRVRGRDGSAVEAIYEMVSESGTWKINGVVTRPDRSRAHHPQNRPTMFPSASTSMVSAPGVLGRPGMVRMSPA